MVGYNRYTNSEFLTKSTTDCILAYIKDGFRCLPVHPSLIIDGQDCLWPSLLEGSDESLQGGDGAGYELGTAQGF